MGLLHLNALDWPQLNGGKTTMTEINDKKEIYTQ